MSENAKQIGDGEKLEADHAPTPQEVPTSGDAAREQQKAPATQAGSSEANAPDATDSAKKLAGELNVDLSKVEGTGSNGRITVDDVKKAARPHYKMDGYETIVYVDEVGKVYRITDEGYVPPALGDMQRIRLGETVYAD